jgi:hypothetical protein
MKTGARRANRDPRLLAVVVLIPAINQSGIAATESAFTKEGNIAHDFTSKSQFLRAQKTQTLIQ